jgi:signal transduction histidine kinase
MSDGGLVREVCRKHDRAVPADSFDESWDEAVRREAVLELQRKARALEAAVDQRSAMQQVVKSALAGRREAEQAESTALAALGRVESSASGAGRVRDDETRELLHQLRTPLNVILGWARMAESRTLEPALLGRALSAIERSAQQLHQLITRFDLNAEPGGADLPHGAS